ncbi:MAG: hypothetical protein V3R52_06695 [Candidatus Neomarinimicrobiota bacterium]
MISTTILGAWIAVFFTLAIFSYLYNDNPFYKIAEHIYVGLSAGYWASIFFWTQIQPNLFGRLWPVLPEGDALSGLKNIWYGIYNGLGFLTSSVFPIGGIDKGHEMNLVYIIPLILGIMMLMSVFSKFSWFARWGIAYVVGMAAGLRSYGYLNSNVIAQIKGSAIPLTGDVSWSVIINGIIILIGTITGLMYFYFSKEHKGWFGKVGRTGIYFLMISFGAAFGFAVMGRISLLIGRFNDLITFSSSDYHHASLWLLVAMVILLGIWSFLNKEEKTTEGIATPK